jgi:hypothetical protein
MRVKSMLAVGFLSMVAVTAVVNVSKSVAADSQRVDVIETLQETVAQSDSMKAGSDRTRVDVIEDIGAGGPTYPYSMPMSR